MLLILMICASGLVEACAISSNKQGWDYDEIGEAEDTLNWKFEFRFRPCQIAKEIDRSSNQHMAAKARPPPIEPRINSRAADRVLI